MRTLPATSLLALAVSLSLALNGPAVAQGELAPAPTPASEPAPTETPADAQTEQQPATDSQIVVSAASLRGTVDTPQPPVLELNEEDIAAYGAGSISDLISALAPSTSSAGGRGGGFPVILVNGIRISSFRELASYPPEAIQKVEVLAAETAQQFGYSPDERVVNIILKRNYASKEIELIYGQPWEGGYSTKEAEGTYLQITGPSRLNFNLDVNDTSLLTEAERGVVQSPGSVPTYPTDPDPAEFRSLVSDSASVEATGNFTTKLGDKTSLSVNATFNRNDNLRYSGLDTVQLTSPTGETALRTFNEDDPLTSDTRTQTYSAGTTVDTRLGDWQITGTADGNHVVSRTLTERRTDFDDLESLQDAAAAGLFPIDGDIDLPDAGFDRADSTTDTLNSLVTAVGHPLVLPGGEVNVTLDTGYNFTRLDSEDTRNPGIETVLKRGDLSAGINLSVPITSRRSEFGGAEFGDLTLNFQGGVDHLSDFGTLTDWTLGLNWGVTERLNFNASYIARDAAPSLGQLGNPETVTENVPVYDLSRGETVLATIISGGNPNLPSQTQRDWRFSINWQLPDFTKAIQQGRLDIQLFKNHSEDVASGFPVLTPTIEAAFPDRVTRCGPTDTGCIPGQIVSIDQRPVTFAEQDSLRVQVGLNFTGPFGKARPQSAAQQQNANPLQQVFRAGQGGQGGQGGQPGAGGPGGQFNPQVFQQLRTKFCTPETANTVPGPADLEGLPEQLRGRLMNADGSVNSENWAQFRTQMCSNNGFGGDPQRLAQLREQFCPKPGEQAPAITEEQLAALPPQLLERLKRPDGKVDPERVNQLRTQFCSNNPQQAQGQAGQQGARGGQQGGPGGTFIFGGPPGGAPPPGGGGVVLIGPGGGGGGFRGPGGGGRGGFGGGGSPDGRGRWFVNFNWVHQFDNTVLVAPGGPLLDLLNGGATSGAQPRNSVQFNGGLFYAGYGVNVNARYAGPSRIDGSGLPGSTDLFFGDLATFNLRLFADLNQRTKLIEDVPLLKNTRITLGLNNVFDARQVVVDDTGTVPLRYQRYLIDPVGRFVQIELRKLF